MVLSSKTIIRPRALRLAPLRRPDDETRLGRAGHFRGQPVRLGHTLLGTHW
jgi:hypothetical protein